LSSDECALSARQERPVSAYIGTCHFYFKHGIGDCEATKEESIVGIKELSLHLGMDPRSLIGNMTVRSRRLWIEPCIFEHTLRCVVDRCWSDCLCLFTDLLTLMISREAGLPPEFKHITKGRTRQ
jgi:hypothetical protein